MDFQEYLNRGTALVQEGKMGPAIESFEEALKLQPANEKVRQFIEQLKQSAKERDELSLFQAQELAKELKAKKEMHFMIWGATDIDTAILEYTEVLRRDPNNADAKSYLSSAYYIQGLTFESNGEQAKAIEAYSVAIQNEPNHVYALNKRGTANREAGNYGEAIEDFKKVIELKPDEPDRKECLADTYVSRAMAFYKKGDYTQAIPDLEMALTFNDDSSTRELLDMAKAAAIQKEKEAFPQSYKETTGKDISLSEVVKDSNGKWAYDGDIKAAEAAVAKKRAEEETAEATKKMEDALAELPKLLAQITAMNGTAKLDIARAEQVHKKAESLFRTLTEHERLSDVTALKTETGILLSNIEKAKQKEEKKNADRKKRNPIIGWTVGILLFIGLPLLMRFFFGPAGLIIELVLLAVLAFVGGGGIWGAIGLVVLQIIVVFVVFAIRANF